MRSIIQAVASIVPRSYTPQHEVLSSLDGYGICAEQTFRHSATSCPASIRSMISSFGQTISRLKHAIKARPSIHSHIDVCAKINELEVSDALDDKLLHLSSQPGIIVEPGTCHLEI